MSDIGRAPNLLPWGSAGRAETPTPRGWVPEGSAISGRMRPRGRFTPPRDSCRPPRLRSKGRDRREPQPVRPRGSGNARIIRRATDKRSDAAANGREQGTPGRMPKGGRER